eukprot:gene38989-48149_t
MYASEGAAVLFGDGGVVLNATVNENVVSRQGAVSTSGQLSRNAVGGGGTVSTDSQQLRPKRMKSVVFEPVVERSGAVSSDPYSKAYRTTSSSREERSKSRLTECRDELNEVANRCEEVQLACMADWSTYKAKDIFWSFGGMSFVEVAAFDPSVYLRPDYVTEDGYRAVTEGVPRNYADALTHPIWGPPARIEWDTIVTA